MKNVIFIIFVLCTHLFLVAENGTYSEDGIRKTLNDFANAWNTHDVKAMASEWDSEGNLISPAGKLATNQQEVERLLVEEHTGRFSKSRIEQHIQFIKFLSPTIAFVDSEILLTGIIGEDPENQNKVHHIIYLLTKKNDKWLITAARVYELHGTVKKVGQ